MNKVYYRGQPYDYEVVDLNGKRLFVLFNDGQLVQYIKEEELDIRSRVSLILDAYYNKVNDSISTGVLN